MPPSSRAQIERGARVRAAKAAHPEMSNPQLGGLLGLTKQQVWRCLNPEVYSESLRRTNARRASAKRAWENENDRRACATCGEPMGIGSHRQGYVNCERCRRVRAEMRELEIVRLRVEEGLSNREIAERIGAPIGSVAVTLSRVRKEGYPVPRDPYMEKRKEVLDRAA